MIGGATGGEFWTLTCQRFDSFGTFGLTPRRVCADPALTFQVSGEATPRKVISADGSATYSRPGAEVDEAPTVFAGHLSNVTIWCAKHIVEVGVFDAVVGIVSSQGSAEAGERWCGDSADGSKRCGRRRCAERRPGQCGCEYTGSPLVSRMFMGDADCLCLQLSHTVQLTGTAGEGRVKVVLQNVDGESVDLDAGMLRVVAAKLL